MLKNLKKRTEGFTIIEVLIVLAIAGLILLVVFLAVPALQRNSRNTQARSEAANILGAVNEFVSNNNGKLPTTSAADATTVKGNTKLSNITTITIEAETGTTAPSGTVAVVRLQAKCNATNNETDAGAARQFAVLYQIENSSGPTTTCTDS